MDERERPQVGEDEVCIKVHACGLCGTDIHIFEGTFPATPPLVLGHEYSGRVIEAGSSVRQVKPGDAVAVDPNIACGLCHFCRKGKIHLCERLTALGVHFDGGFQEFSKAPARQVYRLPESVPLSWGAMAEPVSCCLHGIDLAAIEPGDTVAILGAGAIGLIMLQLAKLAGASKIFVVEPNTRRQALARKLGADLCWTPEGAAFRTLDGGGVDVCIECSGTPGGFASALEDAKRGGTVVVFGVSDQGLQTSISPFEVYYKELRIRGAFVNPNTFSRALELLATRKLCLDDILTRSVPLTNLQDAIVLWKTREELKILIQC
jgi:2-desacetyl-2-hydroxyethyl bacteriochlorophyllide A dehydrogenase